MKLWSLQPLEIAERVAGGERFIADPQLAICYNLDESFANAYHWLIELMEEKIPRPNDVSIPIWAWYTNYGAQNKPDRRRSMFKNYDDKDVVLELDVPDELALLTDFDEWHYVLNNFPLFSSSEEKTIEAGAWLFGYDESGVPLYDEDFKLKSWQRIVGGGGEFTQACIWSLEPEYFVKMHRLRRKI